MSQDNYDRRKFFACGTCELMYAGFDEPDECRVCGSEIFLEVVSEKDPG